MSGVTRLLSMGVLVVGVSFAGKQMVAQTSSGISAYAPVQTTQPSRVSKTSSPLQVVPEDFSKLVLGPGFLLSLEEFDMPEISTDLRVDGDGNVPVPLVGPVHVGGLTLPAAEEMIRQALIQKQILIAPKLSLDVLQYAGGNVTVLGEVNSPGRLQLLAPHTLDEVIAMAGGETQLAGNSVQITRFVDGKKQIVNVLYDRDHGTEGNEVAQIHPGDSITIARAGIVYVMGGVTKPGGYVMQQNGSLNTAQAIAVASGTIMNAGIGGIHIVRREADGSVHAIPVPFRDITNGKVAPENLQDGDILYVPISKVKTVITASIIAATSTAIIYTVVK